MSGASSRKQIKMLIQNLKIAPTAFLLAGVLASGSQSSSTGALAVSAPAKTIAAGTPYRFQPNRRSRREEMYYESLWGVDSLGVKIVESGELVRFSYRVLDADKAKTLNDKKVEPSLIDPQAGVKLVIPSLEQVGQLRQSSTPIAGRSYWMAFSNSGRRVKHGDLVNLVIGGFRANSLLVQ